MQILLVDDKKNILTSVTETLIAYGYSVDTACNGLDALEKLHDKSYDLFVIDHLMPIMDGINLVKNLRKIDYYVQTPVIFMTTQDPNAIQAEYGNELFSALIGKPLEKEKLLNLINHFQSSNTRTQSL